VSEVIRYELDREGEGKVVKAWCRICAKYSHRLRSQLKGQALIDAESYIVGTNYVSKANIMRHLEKSTTHKCALDFAKLDVSSCTAYSVLILFLNKFLFFVSKYDSSRKAFWESNQSLSWLLLVSRSGPRSITCEN
jgi:hypothetical protein